MEKKCINNNNDQYALTIGKNYTIEKSTNTFYYIINDKNKTARYKCTFFEDIVVDNYSVEIINNELIVKNNNDIIKTLPIPSHLSSNYLDCCGVTEIYNVTSHFVNMFTELNGYLNTLENTEKHQQLKNEIITILLQKLINDFKNITIRNLNIITLVISNYNTFLFTDHLLTLVSELTLDFHNENSGNELRVYNILKNDLLDYNFNFEELLITYKEICNIN